MKKEIFEFADNNASNQLTCPRFFHVASEKYKEGDEIYPNNYQNDLDKKKKRIEAELEKFRPDNKPQRAKSTFSFVHLSDAYVFLKQHGGFLYEVTLDRLKLAEQQNTHIGDMGIIELLMLINNQEDRKTWIKKYWGGEMLYKPCVEALIDKVTVKNILIHKEEPTINEFPSNCIHKYMVEYNTEYISLLNKLQS